MLLALLLCFSVSSLSHLPGHYFKSPQASLTLSVPIIYCCIINHLGVSGVTQWSFYYAHRFSVCQEFRWGMLLFQCLGPQLGRLRWLREMWMPGNWNPLEVSSLTYLMPGLWWLESWAQLGLLTRTTYMWVSMWPGASHIRAVGFQEWVSGDPAVQENQTGAAWPFLTSFKQQRENFSLNWTYVFDSALYSHK